MNQLLKMTSLNAFVIIIRLIISVFVQRLLAITLGENGIAKIGQLRNLLEMLRSTSSLGVFNGVVKYTSENEKNNSQLTKLFSSALILGIIGSILSCITLLITAEEVSIGLFHDVKFSNLIRFLAFIPPAIALNKIFYGLINGFSDYKNFAKIELITYVFSVFLLLLGLLCFSLKGVLFSIILSPLVSLIVVIFLCHKRFKEHIKINEQSIDCSFVKPLLAFTLMSFVSTVILNFIELDVRTMIINKINIDEAGYWTAMSFISKNYMVFSSSIFTLYVIPKFAKIETSSAFKKEVFNIYKTILPLFGIGMICIFLFRNFIISLIYPNFEGLEKFFKWQLLGDFVRLTTLVISHQFLAKKMIWSFLSTEIISLGLFYGLSKYFIGLYGAEGVVIAHFYRYIIYFFVVIFFVWSYFKNKENP